MAPLLALKNISRHYQSGDTVVKALDDVSLNIYQGEFVAIMGQSGSGKSTLMNILGCLDRPTAGIYEVKGRSIAAFDADELASLRRQTFGFIFQRYNLLSNASAKENVEVPALYAGIAKEDRQKRAEKLLGDLGLGDRRDHRPGALSGGQQQRVAIARALMNDPPIILADEPTGALDSRSSREVMTLLKDLHAQGRTVIVITHDSEVASHAKRVIKIQDGRILSDDMPDGPSIKETGWSGERAQIGDTKQSAGLFTETIEAVKIALRALQVNFFRTSLTLLGIIIGVAAVVTMLAVGNGSKQSVLDQISAMGTNLLSVRPGAPGMRSSGDIATMTMADAESLEGLSNIVVVVPERSGRKTLRVGNTDYVSSVAGVGSGFPLARDWALASGQFFSIRDVESYAPVIVLGKTVAKTFFPDGQDPIGQYIQVGNIPFQIIGVMSEKGAAPWGQDQDDAVWVPVTTAMIRLFGGSYVNSITLKVEDAGQVDQTEAQVVSLLKERHGKEDFSVRNTASFLAMAMETQNTLTILLGTVAAISLLVGGIGVMNIMLVSVTERTREIGIRMATGARMRDIMVQFIAEAAVVCTIGGFIGVMAGWGTGWIISLFDVDVMFSVMPAALAFTCAVVTGLVFGYLPARKAARLDPVVALSTE
ncbi:MAG: MacB family efflux pump subunit [Micavibrio sp.]